MRPTSHLLVLAFYLASLASYSQAWPVASRSRRVRSENNAAGANAGHLLLRTGGGISNRRRWPTAQLHRSFPLQRILIGPCRPTSPRRKIGRNSTTTSFVLLLAVALVLAVAAPPTAARAAATSSLLSLYNPQSTVTPTLIQQIQWSCRLITAAALGSIIGQERSGHPAGVRTMALVAMGAAMFTLCSLHGFGTTADPSRLAANVASGVGFIGAGVITTSSNSKVQGLTTAAAIWLSAAVGVGCASGLALVATMASLLTVTILRIGKKGEQREQRREQQQNIIRSAHQKLLQRPAAAAAPPTTMREKPETTPPQLNGEVASSSSWKTPANETAWTKNPDDSLVDRPSSYE
jgi:putative Mg2+ transporter-C (MgtC) family protein